MVGRVAAAGESNEAVETTLYILVNLPSDKTTNVKLTLQPLTMDDLDDFYTLHSDARVWEHLPSGRHTDVEKTKEGLDGIVSDWKNGGLSYWSVKSLNGDFAGVGGVRLKSSKNGGTVWNLYYRVSPNWWGCGIAAKVAKKAVQAANLVEPGLSIVAYLLEHNQASRYIAETALKLQLRWRGPDAGNEDPKAIRLVFSDRPLDDAAMITVNT